MQRIFDRRAFVDLLDFTISEPELNGFGTCSSSPSSAEAVNLAFPYGTPEAALSLIVS